MAEKTLIKGGTVLSLDPGVGNFSKADVLYEGTKILEVGQEISANGVKEIDASQMIVMPGFVDTHRHMWQGILRNAGTRFLSTNPAHRNGNQRQINNRFRPADVFASTLSSALGATDAGITTIVNYSDIGLSHEHVQADLDAMQKSGMRGLFAIGVDSGQGAGEARLSDLRTFIETSFAGSVNLIGPALASAGPEFESIESLKREWAAAREMGLRIATQVGMSGQGRAEGIAQAAKANLLGPDVLFAHCNTLSEANLRLIKDHEVEVSLAPAAEMMLGYGQPTIQRMLDLDIQPSLGIDSEGVSRGDLFTQMRAAISMQHALSFEKKLARHISPNRITTRDVLEYVTVAGARAVGMADRIGTLTPGKEADIVLLRQFSINVMPVNDPIGAVVWAMDTSNVDTVIVSGRTLKRNGELVDADLAHLRKITSEARDHIFAAS
ncbi:MAG: amidohydrolase family protein [Anaerolineales bacterium]